jgi:hypothetical protein
MSRKAEVIDSESEESADFFDVFELYLDEEGKVPLFEVELYNSSGNKKFDVHEYSKYISK